MATRLAGIVVVSCVELITFAPTQVDPQIVSIPETKLVPLTVSRKDALPAGTEAGLTLVIVGGGCDTVKLTGADVPPMVVTVKLTLPGVVIRFAGTEKV